MFRTGTVGGVAWAYGRRVLAAGLLVVAGVGCGAGSAGTAAAAGPGTPVKLSAFDKSQYCAFVADGERTLHALFSDTPDPYKPAYLYHRMSRDGGKTWSEAENLSDDGTDYAASMCRLVLDKRGRLYAVWKETAPNNWLDGPGGNGAGRLRFSCREGGRWSKPRLLGDAKVPVYSHSVTADAAGAVHVVWSQPSAEAAAINYGGVGYAGWVRAATLDGSATPAVRDVVYPTPFLSAKEQEDLKAKGIYPTYEQSYPRAEGLLNLSARVADGGVVQFLAERERYRDEKAGKDYGRQIVFWDGKAMTELYEFNRFETHNNFQNPPYLWVRPDGKLSMIRVPEKGATSGVYEYPIEDGALGERRAIAEAPAGGSVINWQPHRLPSGALAITATLSKTKFADDADLFLAASAGGPWTAPVKLSDNLSKVAGKSVDTTAVNRVSTLSHFSPLFTSVAPDADGKMAMVTVSNESTILGFTDVDVGRRLVVNSGGRVDSPAVFFVRLSPEK